MVWTAASQAFVDCGSELQMEGPSPTQCIPISRGLEVLGARVADQDPGQLVKLEFQLDYQ